MFFNFRSNLQPNAYWGPGTGDQEQRLGIGTTVKQNCTTGKGIETRSGIWTGPPNGTELKQEQKGRYFYWFS